MKKTQFLPALMSLLVMCSVCTLAQTPPPDASASIAGRVTIGGKGVAGITVAATISSSPIDNRTVARTTTDDDGNYRLTGLAAGRFTVTPIAKAFVVGTSGAYKQPGQSVNVAEKESVTKIDFALVRGGVITGRITDTEGRPVIGERVDIVAQNNPDAGPLMAFFGGAKNQTDDRGIYRIYGISPGSYKVSVGQPASGNGVATIVGVNDSQYAKTFYLGVAEEAKATIIEINEGTEVTNIDITPSKPAHGFSVSGRVINAESGQPVSNVLIGYSSLDEANQQSGATSFTANLTDATGKFRLEGLQPGRYTAFTMEVGQENSSYSDRAPFDISDGDVTGIEIKVHRGATIDGVAVIENNSDPAVAATLQTIRLFAFVEMKTNAAPSFGTGQISPNGSFHFAGLAPGKVRIGVAGFPTPPKGLSLVRTELDGLVQRDGIEVAAGTQITGVRLIFAYGTGTIRGEVKVEGGALPEGTTFQLFVRAGAGDAGGFSRFVEVDARGHFVAENIPPGTYELSLRAIARDRREIQGFEPVTRTVTIANGAEAQVTLVVNVAARKAGQE